MPEANSYWGMWPTGCRLRRVLYEASPVSSEGRSSVLTGFRSQPARCRLERPRWPRYPGTSLCQRRIPTLPSSPPKSTQHAETLTVCSAKEEVLDRITGSTRLDDSDSWKPVAFISVPFAHYTGKRRPRFCQELQPDPIFHEDLGLRRLDRKGLRRGRLFYARATLGPA